MSRQIIRLIILEFIIRKIFEPQKMNQRGEFSAWIFLLVLNLTEDKFRFLTGSYSVAK